MPFPAVANTNLTAAQFAALETKPADGNPIEGSSFTVNGAQVVGAPIAGWGASTGGVRAPVAAATATVAQVAAALAQLLSDLETHGLIGN